MEFKLKGENKIYKASLVTSKKDGVLIINIDDKDYEMRIITLGSDELNFIIDDTFYAIKILESDTSTTRMLVNGMQISLNKHSKLTEILEKALTLGDKGVGDHALRSQIPGRVVSIMVTLGSDIKKGDPVATLESMKMQVSVKAHKDGVIRDIRVKEGSTVSRNDIIAHIE